MTDIVEKEKKKKKTWNELLYEYGEGGCVR